VSDLPASAEIDDAAKSDPADQQLHVGCNQPRKELAPEQPSTASPTPIDRRQTAQVPDIVGPGEHENPSVVRAFSVGRVSHHH
jgi:hypothetical protein